MINRIAILFILFIFPSYLFSQYSPEIDSLINATNKMQDDTGKVNNLNAICWSLKYSDFETAIEYGKEALDLANKLDFTSGEAHANKNLGGVLYLHNDYTISYNYYSRSLELFQEIQDSINIAKVIRNLGSIYHQQGDYEKAIEYFFESLDMRKKLNDENGIASLYRAIGVVYLEQGENFYSNAIQYFNKALEIYQKINNIKGVANCYSGIASVYTGYKTAKNDEALEYYFKILEIGNEQNDIRLVAQASEAIGTIYLKIDKNDDAYEYLDKSANLWLEMENYFGVGNLYVSIGKYYLAKKNYQESEKYLIDAIDISERIDVLVIKKNSYSVLSQLYKDKGNYQKALEFSEEYYLLKDSLQSEEMSDRIAKFETQREFDKVMKEKELEKQRNQLEHDNKLKNQKIISFATFLGLILMIVLSFVIFRSYRSKKSANELLTDKNEKILLQQKHITSSIVYAKRIQNAVLPPEEFLLKIIPEHFILFKPRDIVSGDFYWAAKKNNTSFIAAVDCTGHGVPGAFMSMLGISFLNEIVNKNPIEKLSAANILEQLRTYIKTSLRQTGKEDETKDGMDMALCSIDLDKNILQFAGAQNPLILIRNNELIQYKGDKMPIGIHIIEKSFTNHEIEIQKNDSLYIFSDGFIDQFGGDNNKKFMIRNFKNLLVEIAKKPMAEQKLFLDGILVDWISKSTEFDQIDDILVIGIKI